MKDALGGQPLGSNVYICIVGIGVSSSGETTAFGQPAGIMDEESPRGDGEYECGDG